jgi:hypothetical protein
MPHPFARGPMTGSAMEILGNLHSPAAATATIRHQDARLLDLGERYTEVVQELAQNEAEYDAILRLVTEECAVPVELSGFAKGLDWLASKNDMPPLSGACLVALARYEIDKPSATWSPGWPAGLTRSGKLAILGKYEAAVEAAFERHNRPAVTARGEALMREDAAILNEIRDTSPQTIAGIVVQLRISNWANGWSKASPDEGYFEHLAGVALRNAERLAGMVQS